MNHFNQITLEGRLVRDPERRATGSGISVLKFTVATNRSWKPEGATEWTEHASFVPCVMFGKQADYTAPKLAKGTHVLVSGSLEEQRWETNEGQKRNAFQIRVDRIRIFDRAVKSEDSPMGASESHGEYPDDDIPF